VLGRSRRRRARAAEAAGHGQAGFTLLETLISMGIMSVAMALATAGMSLMYANVNRTERAATAQRQLNAAVERIAREIRYSSGISEPVQLTAASLPGFPPGQGLRGGDWYVEFSTLPYGGPWMCVQLRLRTGPEALERRIWEAGRTPVGGWSTLSTGVTAAPSAPAFTRVPIGSHGEQERLAVALAFGSDRRLDVTFTALNSSIDATVDRGCAAARSAP
jgi:prepilin-type N-terminal cleavage/methylation domain-containing protein